MLSKPLYFYLLSILIYLSFLLSFGIFRLCSVFIPFQLKIILAAIYFVAIPLLLGFTILELLITLTNSNIKPDLVSLFTSTWCLGFIFLVTISYISYFLFRIDFEKIVVYTIIILIVFNLIRKISKHQSKSKIEIEKTSKIFIFCTFLSSILGLFPVLFITSFSPFPYIYGTDTFRHAYITHLLSKDNFILFQETYLVSQNILLSIVSELACIDDIYSIYWYFRFLTYLILSSGIFLLASEISSNLLISFLAAFIGIWHFSNLYEFIPKNIALTLFSFCAFSTFEFIDKNQKLSKNVLFLGMLTIFTFLLILTFNYLFFEFIGIILTLYFSINIIILKFLLDKNKISFYILIISTIFLALLMVHTFEGAMFVFLLGVIIIISSFNLNKYYRIINYILISNIVLLTLLNRHLPVLVLLHYIPGRVIVSVEEKYSLLLSRYPSTILYLAIAGLICIIIFKSLATKNEILFSTLTLISLLFYLLPIVGTFRAISVLTISISYFAARFIVLISSIFVNINIRRILLLSLTLLVAFSLFSHMHMEINSRMDRRTGILSTITNNDYEIAELIKNVSGLQVIIISDPSTQTFISGIAGTKVIPGLVRSMYYPDVFPQYKTVIEVLSTHDAGNAYFKIIGLLNGTYIKGVPQVNLQVYNYVKDAAVVITPRTINVLGSYGLSSKDINEGIKKFFNKTYFIPLYINNEKQIYIFKVKMQNN